MVHFLGHKKPWLIHRESIPEQVEMYQAGMWYWYELLDELRQFNDQEQIGADLHLAVDLITDGDAT